MVTIIQLSLLLITVSTSAFAKNRALSQDFIESLNKKQSLWVAGRNFPEDTPHEYLKTLAGTLPQPEGAKATKKIKSHNVTSLTLPQSFDARREWSFCSSTYEVRNQGACGSCWAVAAAEAMTDRICIHSSGAVNFEFSAEDILECCSDCGDGCGGGYPNTAWAYYDNYGVVSGGEVGSYEGCKPYSELAYSNGQTPRCSYSCQNGASYSNDKHYGAGSYGVRSSEDQIMAEIMTNGPVEATFDVYEDFYNYQSGVYYYTGGDYTGGHAIKLIGWGTENGYPYWLAANSWGPEWAALGGFFKIYRGVNHVNIEAGITAGMPNL